MKAKWTAADIPNLKDRIAIVTGASSGVGYEIALQLAAHGAHVIVASRNLSRTAEAARTIEAATPRASLEAQALDLADLGSVQSFADGFCKHHRRLDILINNAGVSGGPRRTTKDGFEAHFQINYLGHFALTGRLLGPLGASRGARVVSMSSDIASRGKVNFNDLQSERKYGFVTAYAQAKLANLLFAFELDRRCRKAGVRVASLAANPGVAKSNLLTGKNADWGRPLNAAENLLRIVQKVLALPATKGALPALYQAADPAAQSSDYVVGAAWPKPGYPSIGKIPPASLDLDTARHLWDISADLTGVMYGALAASTHGHLV
jgi:NAD(P)-dependent dehydrogenase (short-subunit alcohol dehydrogenase family)